MADGEGKPDIFYRDAVYPDAQGIFSFQSKSLAQIKNDCIVVLDTNSLLVPYTTGKESLDEIGRIYKQLASLNRLVVPGQVAREFAEHRVTKLKELYQQIARRKTSFRGLGNYPLLSSLPEYQKALQLERGLSDTIDNYNDSLDILLNIISQWYWNDPVSLLYREMFSDQVVQDFKTDQNKLREKLAHNSQYKLPPGYKDAQKLDEGIGDLLIWETILSIGANTKQSVIFVSLDEKADWWSQSEGRALYPRFELVDEFRRSSGGQSFHILKFSAFLNLYGASKDVVEEVRKEERQVFSPHKHDVPDTYEGLVTQNAIYDWLNGRFEKVMSVIDEPEMDYLGSNDQGSTGIMIKYFYGTDITLRRFYDIAAHILVVVNRVNIKQFLLLLVADSETVALALLEIAQSLFKANSMIQVVAGVVSSSGEFFEAPFAH